MTLIDFCLHSYSNDRAHCENPLLCHFLPPNPLETQLSSPQPPTLPRTAAKNIIYGLTSSGSQRDVSQLTAEVEQLNVHMMHSSVTLYTHYKHFHTSPEVYITRPIYFGSPMTFCGLGLGDRSQLAIHKNDHVHKSIVCDQSNLPY